MAEKSEVAVIDILHKNEACHADMLDIMKAQQSYLGNKFDDEYFQAETNWHVTDSVVLNFMWWIRTLEQIDLKTGMRSWTFWR